MAPTGHGKSNALIIGSQKMAQVVDKRVLFITNELSHLEVTERLMSSLTAETLFKVAAEPSEVAIGMDRFWHVKLHEKLRLIDTKAVEISVDDIESMILKYSNLYGWSPDVIVIDFMERMKPTVETKRDQSWNWIGQIAKDLVRLSKKLNVVVWSACQTNRSGLVAKVQDLSFGQGSIQHFQEAKAVIGMHQVKGVDTGDPAIKLLEFRALKMRESSMPTDGVIVECNFAKMHISDVRHQMSEYTQELVDGATPVATDKASKKNKGQLTPQQQKSGSKGKK